MQKLEEEVLMKDPFIRKFLLDEENYNLFQAYQENPTEEMAEKLDWKFQWEHTKHNAIAYLSRAIRTEAINFDREHRKYVHRFTPTLDRPAEGSEGHTFKDELESTINLSDGVETRIEDIIKTHSALRDAIGSLTLQQRRILFLLFFEGLAEKEIARKLGSSQQAVSKSKRKALDKLRREIDGGNDIN